MATAGIPTTGMPPTAALKKDQTRAMQAGRAMAQDLNGTDLTLQTQDEGPEAKYCVYIYNILELPHTRNQPPEVPHLKIEPCPKGQKFSVTKFPAFIKERYEKPGELEYSYKNVDGRKYATSLLNPDTFPGTDFEAQLIEGTTGLDDMTGMNMNAFGVFWSMTPPDSPALDGEIKRFRARADKTMDELVKRGNALNARGALAEISPMMHFAMEYFGLTAPWHMSHRHKTECPNCGELILEGIAYHRNATGDVCILDHDRYLKATGKAPVPAAEPDAPTEARRPRTRTAR